MPEVLGPEDSAVRSGHNPHLWKLVFCGEQKVDQDQTVTVERNTCSGEKLRGVGLLFVRILTEPHWEGANSHISDTKIVIEGRVLRM